MMKNTVPMMHALSAAAWMTIGGVGDAAAERVVKIGDRVGLRATALSGTLDPGLFSEEKISPFDSESMLTGTVTALHSGVLVLQAGTSRVPVPVRDVERAYVWSQGDYAFPVGALGLALGAVIGGFIGHSKEPPADCVWLCPTKGYYAAEGAIVGGLIGCALGIMIGKTQPRDSWTEVSLQPLRVNLMFDEQGGAGLACSATF